MKTLSISSKTLLSTFTQLFLLSILLFFIAITNSYAQSTGTTASTFTVNNDFNTIASTLKLGARPNNLSNTELSISLKNSGGNFELSYYNALTNETRRLFEVLEDGRTNIGGSSIYSQSLLHLDSRAINSILQVPANLQPQDIMNRLRFTNLATDTYLTDGFAIGIYQDGSAILNQNENQDMYFNTNNTRRMTIAKDGQVVIGNPNPDSLLAHAAAALVVDGEIAILANCDNPSEASMLKMCFSENGNGQIRSTANSSLEMAFNGTVFTKITPDGKMVVGNENSAEAHPNATLTVDGAVFISPEGGIPTDITSIAINNQHLVDEYLMWVDGGIVSEEFAISDAEDWADFVFEKGYELRTLEEVEAYIKEHGHLPTVAYAEEVKKGYNLHEMNKQMLQTIEELTLHTIEQNKQIQALMQRIEQLEQQ